MSTVRKLASYIIWPGLLAMFLLAFAETQRRGLDPGLSLLVLTVLHLALIAGFEVLMPARRDWDWRKDGQVINDLIHGALLDVGARLGGAGLTIAIAAVAAQFSTDAPLALWPAAWPLWAQLVIAVLIYDFVDYWKHRAYHEWAWAWPIHALHHNATKMHVFKAGRLHFLEAAIRAGVTSAPLVILGAPPEVFFWLAALSNGIGDQNHWNVETRLPRFLDTLIATPNAHWLHHARNVSNGGANYSSFTLLFDHLFGTFRRQPDDRIEDVGIGFDPIPKNLFGQVLAPFAWPWLSRRARPPATQAQTIGGTHA